MFWSTFLGYARPIYWGVRQAVGQGMSCNSGKSPTGRQRGFKVLHFLVGCFHVDRNGGRQPRLKPVAPGASVGAYAHLRG